MLQIFDSDDWIIAFVDVETTGLNAGYHEVIDVGIVLTCPEGEIIDQFHQRIMPEHPERAQPGAIKCNGFSVERWEEEGAVSAEEAVDMIVEFYEKNTSGYRVMMSAYRSSFDNAFLGHLFQKVDRHTDEIHDYVLDLPSLAWGVGMEHLHSDELINELDLEDEPQHFNDEDAWEHTGLTGADKNRRIYKELISHFEDH